MNLEAAAATGLTGLMETAPIIAVLVLVIMGLCWFIKNQLADAKEERNLNRIVLKDNTTAMTQLTEVIRALSK